MRARVVEKLYVWETRYKGLKTQRFAPYWTLALSGHVSTPRQGSRQVMLCVVGGSRVSGRRPVRRVEGSPRWEIRDDPNEDAGHNAQMLLLPKFARPIPGVPNHSLPAQARTMRPSRVKLAGVRSPQRVPGPAVARRCETAADVAAGSGQWEAGSGHSRDRTCDILLVRQALYR